MRSTRNTARARGAADDAGADLVLAVGLQVLGLVRALVEVAGMFLLAQGALFLLAGRARDTNAVYQLFCLLTRPLIASARVVLPKAIADRAAPFVTFFLLFGLWIFLAYARQLVCRQNGLVCA